MNEATGAAPTPVPRPRDPAHGISSAAFAADLHLSAGDAAGLARAIRLVELCAARSQRLYLLGDVFDLWVSGAELSMAEFQPLFAALRAAAARGLALHFLAGNRDFNLTTEDGAAIGLEVAREEALEVELDGRRLRLLHGDQLLLDDVGYQRMKRVLRSPPMRFLIRRLPALVTHAIGRRIRRYSKRAVPAKPLARLRIVPAAVRAELAGGAELLLCGHVHRLERVDYGSGRELLVLPPFFEEGRFVVLEQGRLWLSDLDGQLLPLPPAHAVQA